MINIKVAYDKARDVQVYLNYLYQFKSYKHGRDNIREELLNTYPEEFRIALNNASTRLEAAKVAKNYLKEKYTGKRSYFRKVALMLEEAWITQRADIEKQLADLYAQKVPFETIWVYYTTTPICPYNFRKREIIVSYKRQIEVQINILKHELNHFMFYYYFPELLEELGKEKFESLKEALTVFTNPEENGYPAHQKLRAWLKEQQGTIPEVLSSNEWQNYF